MKPKSITKNFLYNFLLTIINMLFPLITAPYVSKMLGANNIGKVNFASSIVTWFLLIASFGIPRYGIREIAKNRDDKKELSNIFWNLILVQAILSIIMLFVYLVLVFNLNSFKNEFLLFFTMSSMIILNIFSIDWFYQGIEEYGYITFRNLIFKLISIIVMFFMVRNSNDYIYYALVTIFATCFNNILNFISIKKYIYMKMHKVKIIYYLKELKIYFFTMLVINIYTQFDQTILGIVTPNEELAFYIRSKNIWAIGFSITNSIITVIIPRTAYLINKNIELYNEFILKSLNYIYLLSIPCVIGIFILSKNIMILLGGNEFIPASYSLNIISILILIISVGSWQIQQILLPNKLEKLAFKIQFLAAILSIIGNIFFVPKFSFIGASIVWIIIEFFSVISIGILIRYKYKIIKINYISKSFFQYLISALIMGLLLIITNNIYDNNFLKLINSLVLGPIIYFSLLLIQKENIILNIIDTLKVKYFLKIK